MPEYSKDCEKLQHVVFKRFCLKKL